MERWRVGDVVVRREVLGLSPLPPAPGAARPVWHGRPWLGVPCRVVEDSDDQLAVFVPTGAPFGFPDGPWPRGGRHPWHERGAWEGHGCLMVQRPGDDHAVWHFWAGEDRTFACWYVNIQTAFVRTDVGFDTQDLELDLVVRPDGSWFLKDLEALPARVADGVMDEALVAYVVALGERLGAELDGGRRWWDPSWASWTPDPAWDVPHLPAGWAAA